MLRDGQTVRYDPNGREPQPHLQKGNLDYLYIRPQNMTNINHITFCMVIKLGATKFFAEFDRPLHWSQFFDMNGDVRSVCNS